MVMKAIQISKTEATRLTLPEYKDTRGEWHAANDRIFRGRNSKYRGDVVICAEGETVGVAELVEVVKCEAKSYLWIFRDPRKVVEMPIKAKGDIWDCEEEITIYPRELEIGAKGWEIIQKKIR